MAETLEATETRNFPAVLREARFLPETINTETRTAELLWSTGADVIRADGWTGQRWVERLSMDPTHIRMGRLQSGAPLLDTHNAYSLRGILGVVDSATVANGEGRALVRFADTADVEPIWRMVEQKIIRNVSVGYIIHRMRDVSKEDDKVRTFEAVDWEPTEISLVPVGADAGAGVRSNRPDTTYPCTITRALPEPGHHEENPMTEVSGNPPVEEVRTVETVVETRTPPKVVASVTDITAAMRALKRSPDEILAMAERAATESLTIEAVREIIINEAAEKDEQVETRSHVTITRDEVDTVRALAENAIMHRYDPAANPLEDGARQFMGRSLLEVGTDLLERRGVSTRGLDKLQRSALVLGMDTRSGTMHTTSDFPYILANVANKSLRNGYTAAQRTFTAFCRRTTLPDFKQASRVQLGEAPVLKEVNEHGEFTYGTIGEGREVYNLVTFGRIVAVTRQVIINDDLSAFTRIPAMMGGAAANLESNTIYAILTGNPLMGDGYALFSTEHNNFQGAGSAPDVSTIGAGMVAIGSQTGLDSDDTTYLNLQGRYLIGGWQTHTVRAQYTSANFQPTGQSGVNPYTGLIPITDARITDTSWYIAADPSQIDTIEYAYLDGQEGVYTETRVGFEVDGVEIKARHDFAAKAIDHRGLYRNDGSGN